MTAADLCRTPAPPRSLQGAFVPIDLSLPQSLASDLERLADHEQGTLHGVVIQAANSLQRRYKEGDVAAAFVMSERLGSLPLLEEIEIRVSLPSGLARFAESFPGLSLGRALWYACQRYADLELRKGEPS